MKDYAVARRRMVAEQLAGAGVSDRRVLAAMEEVPRHRFVPRLLHHRAHQPSALPIGFAKDVRLTRAVAEGEFVCFADVALDQGGIAFALREEAYALMRGI